MSEKEIVVEQNIKTTKPIPKLSGAKPETGHLDEYHQNQVEFLTRARRECGELAQYELGAQPYVLLSGPDANEAFCRAPDEQLSQAKVYRAMTPVFGKGVIFDADPEIMKQQLKIQVQALRHDNMKEYAKVIADEVADFTAKWGDKGEIDLVDAFTELTLYTSTSCLLGTDFRQSMTSEFASLYADLEHAVIAIAFIDPYLPIPEFAKRDAARIRLAEMVAEILQERRDSGREYHDALATFMNSTYKDGSFLNHEEITGLLIATMFAGHHTSSGTAVWTLVEFLRNPQFAAPILNELQEIFNDGGEVSHHVMRSIPKLEEFVMETLRLHPPLVILLREVLQDLHYKDYLIPAGYNVVMSPAVSHKIPEVFDEPEKFNPNRPEPEHLFAFIAFGGGRHKCAGNAFAILQLKAIFATLLLNFEFELVNSPESYGDDHSGMTVKPAKPCRVRYIRKRLV